MIRLVVMDRCHGCPEFQAKQILWSYGRPFAVGDIVIQCEKGCTCRYIEEDLKRRETT